MAGDVILGYDGSDGSHVALAVAVSVARAYKAPLRVVFGYEPNPMGGETADYKVTLEKIGKERVEEGAARVLAIDGDVEVHPLVMPLRPAESLLEAARQYEARVIVVGGSGERPILGAILGSVPHKLLHRSTVPVLVVPHGEE